MITPGTYKLLAASGLRGIGRKGLLALATEKIFFQASVSDLRPALSEIAPQQLSKTDIDAALGRADEIVRTAEERGHHVIGVGDPHYPVLLRELPDRPAILFLAGELSRLTDLAVAIIGTREPTAAGRVTAERITTFFASRGWQVVSGLAVGIDTVAHSASLEAGGSTVAVLAHGLEKIYPKENEPLARKIVEKGGLLISEYAYGSSVFAGNFVERDRIQAGLARAVIMVQSDETGGSWHASRAALRYGRFLIVPRATDTDIRAGEVKIRGNTKLFGATVDDRAAFLKCKSEDLNRLVLLRSKDEYSDIANRLLTKGDRAHRSKLREAVHYVCKKYALQPQKLGAVKLQKIIWYFDVKSYVFTQHTATGAVFVKGDHGPFSKEIGEVIKELVGSDRLFTDREEFHDTEKTRLVGKGDTDVAVFSDKEQRWLDEIATDVCENHTAGSISERSHGAIWKMAQFGEVIPFAATAVGLRTPSSDAVAAIRKDLGLA